jgi:RNA polymerase-binding transcription factor DksA
MPRVAALSVRRGEIIYMPDPANEPTPMPRAGLIPDPKASPTEQILGIAAQPDATRAAIDPKWHRFYDKLLEARDKFIDSSMGLQASAFEVKHDAAQDEPAEIGTEGFQRDQLLGMVTFDQETLEEINEALSRMQNGTYGICQLTQQQIPEERLEAVPWTRYTVEARQEMEARGKTSQVALGPLGGVNERGTAPAGPWRDHEGSI